MSYLSSYPQTVKGSPINFWRTSNDVNGNPRYIVHYLFIARDYDTAHKIAKSCGGRKYTGRAFGGGFVFQSYSLDHLAQYIEKAKRSAK